MQFRADFINALNNVHYQGPNTDITSASFGRITAQNNIPRWIQFQLRFTFWAKISRSDSESGRPQKANGAARVSKRIFDGSSNRTGAEFTPPACLRARLRFAGSLRERPESGVNP